jgi:hypothetical protein
MLKVSEIMTMTQLEAAIEDWEEIYKTCKLRREFGPLPVLIRERQRRIAEFENLEREGQEVH